VLLPVWAKQTGAGAGTLGLVFATMSGASVIGALVAAKWGERIPRFRMYVVAFLVAGLPRFVVLAVGAPLGLVLGVSVVAGVFSGFLNPILGAVFFERIPAHLTGRVSSLSTSLCFALMPLGGLVGGLLVSGFGLSPALLAVGAAYLLATMAPLVVPSFRAMDRPATAASERRPVEV
jgi:MFS family permease